MLSSKCMHLTPHLSRASAPTPSRPPSTTSRRSSAPTSPTSPPAGPSTAPSTPSAPFVSDYRIFSYKNPSANISKDPVDPVHSKSFRKRLLGTGSFNIRQPETAVRKDPVHLESFHKIIRCAESLRIKS